MKFLEPCSLLALATLLTLSTQETPDPLPLLAVDVKIQLEPTAIPPFTLIFNNNSTVSVNVPTVGGILDTDATEKVEIWQGSTVLDFVGVRPLPNVDGNVSESSIQLAPGQTRWVPFDLGSSWNLPAGSSGTFSVAASGKMPYSNDVVQREGYGGTLQYSSNVLEFDPAQLESQTSSSGRNLLWWSSGVEDESDWYSNCTGERLTSVESARRNCKYEALRAATWLRDETDDLLYRWFGKRTQKDRDSIIDRFTAIGQDCGRPLDEVQFAVKCATASNKRCKKYGMKAYAEPEDNHMVLCDPFFDIPLRSTACWQIDQGGIILHEMTHGVFPGHYNLPLGDFSYTYPEFINDLSDEQKFKNAATYNFYADATLKRCTID